MRQNQYSGNREKVINAASDERLKIFAEIPQHAAAAKPARGCSPKVTPNAVATPIPPLKSKKIGYMCPSSAPKPTKAMVAVSSVRAFAMATGSRPFTKSPARVMAAGFLPPRRSTLVAPGLPDPSLRGSGNPSALQTKIAAETDPIMYASTLASKAASTLVNLFRNETRRVECTD